ncbi:NAD(P)-dependent oxidoreductase [Bacteroidota bacterium]
MKVLIADKYPDNYMQELKAKNSEIAYEPKFGENEIAENIKGVDYLIVRSTKVNAEAINNSDNLKIIIRAGSGYNTIDVEAASAKGVSVANTPGKNSVAVAELAMGLMISLDRKIPDNVADFKNSVWNKAEYSKADGLKGKTLGVIGVGNIGKEFAARAKAFGMKVYGYDIVRMEGIDLEYVDDIKQLVADSDVISLHLPANDKTKGMFNKEMFDLMKNGATLINTSRPQVIDEDALIDAVKTKNIKAGLDVFLDEPEGKTGEVKSKFQGIENIYVTHHIGASTAQAQDAVAQETVKIISTHMDKGEVLNCVNK